MGWQRFIFGTDLHGDVQHTRTARTFLDFSAHWKPDIKVFGGDAFDLRPLRRGASEDERHQLIKGDVDAGMAFLKEFQPTHFLRGNHDERLWDLRENGTGAAQAYAEIGCKEIVGALGSCKMLPYHKRDGVLKIGHLKFLHGFHCGVFAARQCAMIYGSALMGHTHVIDQHPVPGLERRVARIVGCLCQLDMDYNSRQPNTLRQAHGFAYGVINDKTGNFHCWQAEEIGGKWFLPTDIVEWTGSPS
jgi:hypothetical protein